MELESPQTSHLANIFSRLPLVSLLITNAIPLIGVLFFGWDAFLIVLLYWSENVAVGFYNVLKMATARIKHPAEVAGRLFPIGFFIIHYSGFTGIHGVFVLHLFDKEGDFMKNAPTWPCFLAFIQILFNTIRQAYLAIPTEARWVIVLMFISHGISFGYNYLHKREYATVLPQDLMIQPYGRIFIMHITIIAGAFLTMAFGSPVGLLVMLIILKTAIDVALHKRQHKPVACTGGKTEKDANRLPLWYDG